MLSIRLKDDVFNKWLQRLRQERVLLNDSFSQSISQIGFTDRDFTARSSNGETSSIMSPHFFKAKLIYRLKKIFNRYCLKIHFDCFVLKLFAGKVGAIKILKNNG